LVENDRTKPVDGKFMSQQKDLYDYLVLLLPVAGTLGGVFLAGWFSGKS
jgi:hypothetical protein